MPWRRSQAGNLPYLTFSAFSLANAFSRVKLSSYSSSLTDEVRDFALPNLLPEVKDLTTLVRLLYWNTIYLASCVLVPPKPLHSSKLPILTYPPSYDLTAFLRLVLSVHSLP